MYGMKLEVCGSAATSYFARIAFRKRTIWTSDAVPFRHTALERGEARMERFAQDPEALARAKASSKS